MTLFGRHLKVIFFLHILISSLNVPYYHTMYNGVIKLELFHIALYNHNPYCLFLVQFIKHANFVFTLLEAQMFSCRRIPQNFLDKDTSLSTYHTVSTGSCFSFRFHNDLNQLRGWLLLLRMVITTCHIKCSCPNTLSLIS